MTDLWRTDGSSQEESECTLFMFPAADFQWPVETHTPTFLLEILLCDIFYTLYLTMPKPFAFTLLISSYSPGISEYHQN